MNILVWFRRDLRLQDNAALSHALATGTRVWCVFVFDREILDPILARGMRTDRRVSFIHASLLELDAALRERGGGMIVRHGMPREEIPCLAAQLEVAAVYANRDYDPAALDRDRDVERRLRQDGRNFLSFKDQVVFERDEILSGGTKPYSVFTPYRNAWLKRLTPVDLEAYPCESRAGQLAPRADAGGIPSLEALGFAEFDAHTSQPPAGSSGAERMFEAFLGRIDAYAEARNFPAVAGTSYLSVHLRFGTISIRRVAGQAQRLALHASRGAATWLDELIWREFYQMILWHYPRVVDQAYKPAYVALQWDDAPDLFAAWCEGRTGYPLVDAAMRQIAQTGYMHNRLRMVVASFLCKDLGLDWRLGEQYFAARLIDFELASNNGGWQWAASTGCDAQPWFRIFNPVTQSEKFDAQGVFIRYFVPELARVAAKHIHAPWRMSPAEQATCATVIGRDYPAPLVDHALARQRTLERYGRVATAVRQSG